MMYKNLASEASVIPQHIPLESSYLLCLFIIHLQNRLSLLSLLSFPDIKYIYVCVCVCVYTQSLFLFILYNFFSYTFWKASPTPLNKWNLLHLWLFQTWMLLSTVNFQQL